MAMSQRDGNCPRTVSACFAGEGGGVEAGAIQACEFRDSFAEKPSHNVHNLPHPGEVMRQNPNSLVPASAALR